MSTFGEYFKVTTYGESHCRSVGCIIDGCPPGMALTEADIQPQMDRRRPGQSDITTPRNEADAVEIQSGTEFGVTLGTPIGLRVLNKDQRPKDYGGATTDRFPRPSHADWTYLQKYGVKASSGGGRSSARETIGRVAAGAIAEKYLRLAYGIEIVAFVSSVGRMHLHGSGRDDHHDDLDGGGGSGGGSGSSATAAAAAMARLLATVDRQTVDSFAPVRCPDAQEAKAMAEYIAGFRDRSDSIGGTVTCVIRNAPPGLGEPCFDKLEAKLAHAMLSIPATKGFEIGSGFAGCEMPGSLHNDPFVASPDLQHAADVVAAAAASGMSASSSSATIPPGAAAMRSRLTTRTNNSGGVQGGISNGAPIYFRVAFKPPATIGQEQTTATYDGSAQGVLAAKGRHDPCVVPRAVPIVEAMAALVVMDAVMAQQARYVSRQFLPKLPPSLPVVVPQVREEREKE